LSATIEERLDRIERDIAYLRGVVEQLDKRFSEFREYIEERFESIERRFNHVETEIRELRAEIRGWVRWTIGISVTMWATIMAVLLQILLRTG